MLPPGGEFLRFAHELADAARTITGQYFRRPLAFTHKADDSPVTVADRETENHLRRLIRSRYPGHAIIGEEAGSSGKSSWQWILDPIDGTKSFLSGFPVYCTLIALLHDERPLLSVVDMPRLDERFTATRDDSSRMNGAPVKTRATSELENALCYSTDPAMFTAPQKKRLAPLRERLALQRYGGDGYLYAMLAAGWIDLVIEADMKPYDYLPLILLIERAGGVISDWEGKALTLESKGEILASATSSLHEAAVRRLQMGNTGHA